MANRQEVMKILRALPDGWTYERTKRSHWRIEGPEGQLLFCSSTPSDIRALYRIKQDLRKLMCP